jgi:AcrR family transcriptional regulator
MTNDTRDNLLKTARSLFGRLGFQGVSIRQLCKEAGCNLASVSYYFRGKDELYRECMEDPWQHSIRRITQMLETPTGREDFKAKLRLFLLDFYDELVRNADVVRIIAHESHNPTSSGQEVIDRLHRQIPARLEDFIISAQNMGFVRGDLDVAVLCQVFLGQALHSVQFEDLIKKKYGAGVSDPATREKFVDQIIKLTAGGMYV